MKAPTKLKSDFAIVDIMAGRKRLEAYLKGFPDKHQGLPVIIYGRLTYPWGVDDGTSIEFCLDVDNIKVVDNG
jgi:hypothetical protein